MNLSLQNRLLFAATFILAAFLGVTGLVLNNAYKASAITALNDRLQVHVYALLTAAELNDNFELDLPGDLPEPRFATIGSGLFAVIKNDNNQEVWRSASSIGAELPFSFTQGSGDQRYHQLKINHDTKILALSHSVEWEINETTSKTYHFYVAEDLAILNEQTQQFSKSLWTWLTVSGVLLLATQAIILGWSLSPLRQVEKDLTRIENGKTDKLTGNYPKELRGLTNNLNSLITSTQKHMERYRNTLGNLAHSLKTPMAVLRGAADDDTKHDELRLIIREQIQRMDKHVDYQLKRASTSGSATLSHSVEIYPIAKKIINALNKVYADKNITSELNIDKNTQFFGDEGDLLELIGNLSDNAYKFCKDHIKINAYLSDQETNHSSLILEFEDNGPGIAPDKIKELIQRGQRGDEMTEGQGIGLAMVNEIINIYNGSLTIKQGTTGNNVIMVTFQ